MADYFENFDLESVVTPVDVQQFSKLLAESGYDKDKTAFLVNGFTRGFSIGYDGPTKVQQTAPN